MDRLKGKTILIGRAADKGRLAVAIKGSSKMAELDAEGAVPTSVSRCSPSSGTAHCTIDVDQEGALVITNLKAQNITLVNGMEVQAKHISPSDTIALGREKYPIDLTLILHTAIKLVSATPAATPAPAQQPKTFSIKPLETIWDEYKEKCRAVRNKSRRIALIRSLCGVFTSGALICIHFFGTIGLVLTGIGLIGNIYSFVGLKNNDTTEEIDKLDDWLDDNYICPNPACQHSIGKSNKYKYLLQNGKCPYCHCTFTEG